MAYTVTPEQAAAYDTIIYKTAIADGMPDYIAQNMVLQARYETENYTSNNFNIDTNAFGYKFVKGAKWQLPTPGITSSEKNKYAAYASLENSVHDVVGWLLRRQNEGKLTINNLTDSTSYANALKNCEYYDQSAAEYAAGLQAEKKNVNFTIIAVAGSGMALILLIIAVYYIISKRK